MSDEPGFVEHMGKLDHTVEQLVRTVNQLASIHLVRIFTTEQDKELAAAIWAALQPTVRKLRSQELALQRFTPCPDCRDKVKSGECERCKRQRAEARLHELCMASKTVIAELEAGAYIVRDLPCIKRLAEIANNVGQLPEIKNLGDVTD